MSEVQIVPESPAVHEAADQPSQSWRGRWKFWLLAVAFLVIGSFGIRLLFVSPLDRAIQTTGGSIERPIQRLDPYGLLNKGRLIVRRCQIVLRGSKIDDDWIRSHLAELQQENSLEMKLIEVALSPEGYKLLASCRSLNSLSVRNSPFDRRCLQELQAHPFLANVHFVGTQLEGSDLEILTRFPNCWFVGIDAPLATEAGFSHLKMVSGLMGLTLYEAANDQITLASGMQGMRHLNLYGAGVTDDCIPTLSGLPALEVAQFWGTGLTGNGESALRQKLSRTHIFSISAQHPGWHKVEERLGLK